MSDCLIVGGGISGMLTAWKLHEAGLKVTLLEQGWIGQESSWAGGGILSPLYPWRYPKAVTALAQWSQLHYAAFTDQLARHSGIDPEYTRNGFLILDVDEYPQASTWATQEQVILEKLDAAAVHACEPELGDYAEALWLPDIAQIRNPRLLKALKESLLSAGVSLQEHCKVTSLSYQDNKIIGVETKQHGFIAAQRVVVTAGAWSALLLDSLGISVAIQPIRGQMILFKTQPGLISRIVLLDSYYVIPRRDGHVLVGSTLEDVGFDKQTTEKALQDLKYLAFDFIPRIADYQVQKQWAGLRPSSPQGIPYIGKHPLVEGLYVNSGHFRNGIVLGLASAHLLVDIMLERSPILDASPYTLTAQRD